MLTDLKIRNSKEDSDEKDCLNHLMTTMVTLITGQSRADLTIGEAIELSGWHDCLKTYGLKVTKTHMIIAVKHAELERIYRDTPWACHWGRPLARLPGAECLAKTSFGSSEHQARAVALPLPGSMELLEGVQT